MPDAITVTQIPRKRRNDWRVRCVLCRQQTDYGTRKAAEQAAVDHYKTDHEDDQP